MYPLGWPFSIFLAAIGVPISIKINVMYDIDANVYVATSKDLKGLVVEADTFEEVKKEVLILIPELLSLNVPTLHRTPSADLSFNQHLFTT